MKAWLVTNYEGIGTVVFADTASKAKADALYEDGFERGGIKYGASDKPLGYIFYRIV